MTTTCNSSRTNRLLQRVRSADGPALDELFALHRERLRKMVRLRLDRRLRGLFTSSAVLQEVYRDATRRVQEYLDNPGQSVFLWLRLLTGQRIQALHRQHLGANIVDAGQEFSLYRGALPQVHSVSLAAQLIGDRPVSQPAARAEMLLRLQDALNGMDALDREVLALCHFEELRDEEVAAVLGIDRTAATLHYVRALKRLKEILNSIPGFFDHKGK
jgi:RNA polymerase sigma-70 factor (ECF subfamily)